MTSHGNPKSIGHLRAALPERRGDKPRSTDDDGVDVGVQAVGVPEGDGVGAGDERGADPLALRGAGRRVLAKLAAAWANSPADSHSDLNRSLYSSSTRSRWGSDSRLLPMAVGMYSFRLSG